ncbi:hypothetical protein ACHAO9_010849 [Fusarium lateritium]
MDNTENHNATLSWMQQSPFAWLGGHHVAYLAFCLGISAYTISHLVAKASDKWPVLNPTGFEILGIKRRMEFAKDAGDLIEKGRQVFPQQPYHMMTDTCDLLILPPKFVDGIRNNPDLNFTESVVEDFHASIPGFEPFRDGREDVLTKTVVRKQLTKLLNQVTEPLSVETDFALEHHFGTSSEWKEYEIFEEVLDVVARVSTRVFLGSELCRNEEWLSITKNYTVDSFIAAYILRIFPKPLRHIAHWFVPQCQRIRQQFADSKKLIMPVIQARRTLRERMQVEGKPTPDFNDAIDWLDHEAKGEPYDEASCQLGLSMAAIHTTTDLIVESIQNIMLHPELVEDLRKEIVQVLGAQGWKKTSLYNLKLVDSVVKESQRLRPAGMIAMQRTAIRDTKLPDGSVLPKGQRCAIDVYGPSGMADRENYENPDDFDPYRFARMRGQPGLDAKSHLVSTGPAHLGFGHGQHSCPGRFFSSNEIKVVLCHLLINYDWKFAPGFTPKRMENGFDLGTDPKNKVLLRRRNNPEIDLLNLQTSTT